MGEQNISTIIKQAHAFKNNNEIDQAIKVLQDANAIKEHPSIVITLIDFLMSTSNFEEVLHVKNIEKYDPVNFTLAKNFLNVNVNSTVPLIVGANSPVQNLAMISMLKNDADIILINLIWHYQLGIRKFFLINNLSTDETFENIKLFQNLYHDATVFVLHDPIIEYFQGKKTSASMNFAMTFWKDIDWLVIVDSDEFLSPTRSLDEVFMSLDDEVDALILPKSFYNLLPEDSAEDSDLFFRRIQHRTPLSHNSSKAIVRANRGLYVGQGNHHVYNKDNLEIKSYGFSSSLSFREFRVRSFEQYKRRVIDGGKAILAAKKNGFNQVGGDHWEGLYNFYLAKGDHGFKRHFESLIQTNINNTIILDPMPLDLILEKIDADHKISKYLFKSKCLFTN